MQRGPKENHTDVATGGLEDSSSAKEAVSKIMASLGIQSVALIS